MITNVLKCVLHSMAVILINAIDIYIYVITFDHLILLIESFESKKDMKRLIHKKIHKLLNQNKV